ncbi:MAG: type 1 glutamine amidotransferase domain-containing protein [Nostocaceae cyanobacterium]|nr:type 1 glutamine amidotransferase domain-containing protein [Nostocaceae cyanobacterium]
MSKKVLIVVTSHDSLGDTDRKTGFYLSEVTHPYDVFTSAGFDVDFVSPKGGKAPIDGVNLEDPLNKAFLENPQTLTLVENTLNPAQIAPGEYQGMFYAGGHGTMWDFPNHEQLAKIAATIYEQGGVVAAVCHGPAGLVNIKLSNGEYLIAGKNVTAFTNEEEEAVELTTVVPFLLESKLMERGAKFECASKFEPHVVVSDRVVTGQNPASARGVGEAVVNLIENTAAKSN